MSTKTFKLPFFQEKRSCLGTLSSFAMSLFVSIAVTADTHGYIGAVVITVSLSIAALALVATLYLNVIQAHKSSLFFDIVLLASFVFLTAYIFQSSKFSVEVSCALLMGLIFSRITQRYGDYLEKRHMQRSA